MSKYQALTAFLNQQASDKKEVRLAFAELERLVGPLPPSARSYRPWWGNSAYGQALAWQEAGWVVDSVNLTAQRVVFARGEAQRRSLGGPIVRRVREAAVASTGRPDDADAEASVQARLVAFLSDTGWEIKHVADTATKEAGIDVLAVKAARVLAVEVKGYPSIRYADPRRADDIKPTNPATQARHWYAQALLKAMLTRDEHPGYEVAIGLPEAAAYRSLHRRTARSLDLVGISVLFVSSDGPVMKQDSAGIGRIFT
ncbi:MAG TPA: hypothetical protein VFW21_11975 [Mycobacterium sp.]|nr:hypothetical protein [Mycobacterium sp.]